VHGRLLILFFSFGYRTLDSGATWDKYWDEIPAPDQHAVGLRRVADAEVSKYAGLKYAG
jgi:hypothetical protein